jgi:hypothetical protein
LAAGSGLGEDGERPVVVERGRVEARKRGRYAEPGARGRNS